jgi:hypothetical protein
MLRRKIFTTAVAAASLCGLALAGTGAANASVHPKIVASQYQVVKDGTAGYYDVAGLSVHNIGASVTPQLAAENIGGVGQGGIGTQLCDPNNGWGMQEGLVSNGSTFSVDYAVGTLAGASADGCVGNGVLANPHVLNANLTGLMPGDTVQLYMSYGTYKKTNGTKAQGKGKTFGAATFQAFDATTGFEVYTDIVWKLPVDGSLNSAGAGIQQDTTGLSANTPLNCSYYDAAGEGCSGASNDVADFSGVFVNGSHGIFGGGHGLATFGDAVQVITTGGGLKINAATVAPNDSLTPTSGFGESDFSVYAGQVLS